MARNQAISLFSVSKEERNSTRKTTPYKLYTGRLAIKYRDNFEAVRFQSFDFRIYNFLTPEIAIPVGSRT